MAISNAALRRLFLLIVLSVAGFFSYIGATQVIENVFAATTITVTSSSDTSANDGNCTLREAITAANNDTASGVAVGECAAGSGTDTIEFNITGAGPHTISPTSSLPTITADLTINGYSEPGSSANTNASPATFNGTLMIEIDGTSAGTSSGFNIQSDIVVIRGLAINSFVQNGIVIDGSSMVTIAGNYIGPDINGTTDAGNGSMGVQVFNSTNNTIGGTNEADRNVISGNGDNAVYMQDVTTNSIAVEGNYLGLASNGAAMGNDAHGVDIIGGPINITIGGSTTSARNVISSNGGSGVYLNNADGNTIAGNYIGTDSTGEIDRGNTENGVILFNGSSGNTVGGDTSGERNIIAGNNSDGVEISDASTTTNTVSGNYIGTDDDGVQDLSNTLSGVRISSSPSNTIGGSTSGTGNTISGNNENGISLVGDSSDNNVISGNIIGLTATGTTALGNTADGLAVVTSADNTTIGGDTSAERNVVSGNGDGGIDVRDVAATATAITGNYIGTNSAGDADRGNVGDGIYTSGTATIGGATTGLGNVISGNGNNGVTGDTTTLPAMTIKGNLIGLSADGSSDLGNDAMGMAVSDSQVGGTTAGARNVISGNGQQGMMLTNSNTVQGNYIGISADGESPIANGGPSAAAVQLFGDNNVFGGSATGAGNVISGNSTATGIAIAGSSLFGGSSTVNNVVQGNYIGTNTNGVVETGFGNSSAIATVFDAENNLIGGSAEGERNVIAGNGAGIFSYSSNGQVPLNNTYVGNSIHTNDGVLGGLGIDLAEDSDGNFVVDAKIGVTANVAGDLDTGTNDYLNFPVLDSTSATAGTLNVQFDLDVDGTAPNGYRIEFFANNTADASGNGEGQLYLGSVNVAGDVTNSVASLSIPASFTTGTYSISATTTERDNSTDTFGATSEFSANLNSQSLIAASNSTSGSTDLADTGQNLNWILYFAFALITSGVAGAVMVRKFKKLV